MSAAPEQHLSGKTSESEEDTEDEEEYENEEVTGQDSGKVELFSSGDEEYDEELTEESSDEAEAEEGSEAEAEYERSAVEEAYEESAAEEEYERSALEEAYEESEDQKEYDREAFEEEAEESGSEETEAGSSAEEFDRASFEHETRKEFDDSNVRAAAAAADLQPYGKKEESKPSKPRTFAQFLSSLGTGERRKKVISREPALDEPEDNSYTSIREEDEKKESAQSTDISRGAGAEDEQYPGVPVIYYDVQSDLSREVAQKTKQLLEEEPEYEYPMGEIVMGSGEYEPEETPQITPIEEYLAKLEAENQERLRREAARKLAEEAAEEEINKQLAESIQKHQQELEIQKIIDQEEAEFEEFTPEEQFFSIMDSEDMGTAAKMTAVVHLIEGLYDSDSLESFLHNIHERFDVDEGTQKLRIEETRLALIQKTSFLTEAIREAQRQEALQRIEALRKEQAEEEERLRREAEEKGVTEEEIRRDFEESMSRNDVVLAEYAKELEEQRAREHQALEEEFGEKVHDYFADSETDISPENETEAETEADDGFEAENEAEAETEEAVGADAEEKYETEAEADVEYEQEAETDAEAEAETEAEADEEAEYEEEAEAETEAEYEEEAEAETEAEYEEDAETEYEAEAEDDDQTPFVYERKSTTDILDIEHAIRMAEQEVMLRKKPLAEQGRAGASDLGIEELSKNVNRTGSEDETAQEVDEEAEAERRAQEEAMLRREEVAEAIQAPTDVVDEEIDHNEREILLNLVQELRERDQGRPVSLGEEDYSEEDREEPVFAESEADKDYAEAEEEARRLLDEFAKKMFGEREAEEKESEPAQVISIAAATAFAGATAEAEKKAEAEAEEAEVEESEAEDETEAEAEESEAEDNAESEADEAEAEETESEADKAEAEETEAETEEAETEDEAEAETEEAETEDEAEAETEEAEAEDNAEAEAEETEAEAEAEKESTEAPAKTEAKRDEDIQTTLQKLQAQLARNVSEQVDKSGKESVPVSVIAIGDTMEIGSLEEIRKAAEEAEAKEAAAGASEDQDEAGETEASGRKETQESGTSDQAEEAETEDSGETGELKITHPGDVSDEENEDLEEDPDAENSKVTTTTLDDEGIEEYTEGASTSELTEPKYPNVFVKSDKPEAGYRFALEYIKKIPVLQRPHSVAKTNGKKLSMKGVQGSEEKLRDRILIVEQAGSLSQVTLNELYRFLIDVNDCMLVLIDSPMAIEKLRKKHPDLAAMFKKELVYVDMSADDLVKHAKIYAQEQDCIIDELGTLALYSIIEKTLQNTDGSLLSEVETLVDDAIEIAEKVSVGNIVKGIFGGKYNKEGQLVLKEEHFNRLRKDLFKE